MPVMKKSRKAFTLVELLIVASMLGVVSLAMFSLFNNGFKVWQKISQPVSEQDIDIFLDKWATELENCLKINGVVFGGDKNRCEIPTLVKSIGLNRKTIGKVVYSYNQQAQILNRQQSDYSQLYSENEGTAEQVLKNIDFLKFTYYDYDAQNKEYIWKDEWTGGSLPLAVRVEFTFNAKDKNDKFIKTVDIPISG